MFLNQESEFSELWTHSNLSSRSFENIEMKKNKKGASVCKVICLYVHCYKCGLQPRLSNANLKNNKSQYSNLIII